MSELKVNKDEIQKALSKFTDLAKAHKGNGTASTTVDSMEGEGGATQVFHTGSNSNPGSWAGAGTSEVAENGASDNISENGTDWEKAVKKAMDKVVKGEQLSADEKKVLQKAAFMPFAKKDDKDDKDEDKKDVKKAKDEDEDTKKSLSDHVEDNSDLSGALEVSEFLTEFVGAITKSHASMEQRVTQRVVKSITASIEELAEKQGDFNGALAKALEGFATALVQVGQRVEQVESTPARGAKSARNTTVLEKSMDSGDGEELTKSQINDTLMDLVVKGRVSQLAAIKFDSSGVIDETTLSMVRAQRAGK